MKKLIFFLLLAWGAGAGGLWYWNKSQVPRTSYRTVAIHRGDLISTINATGTIEPEEVVDVGAQVAGEVVEFGVDPRDPNRSISYGSPVDRGTVLARLDASLLRARVSQATAGLLRAEADLLQAEVKLKQADRELDRSTKLHNRAGGLVSVQEHDTCLANQEVAHAGIAVAKSAIAVAKGTLEEANVNLGYTTIRSPVKGVILDRRVNIGQTVVASLNAPSVFLIAKDLRRMQIWASVNETDVGSIHVGQNVRFSIGAFPNEEFHGKVGQIRLNASMSQNVVTYTVVVDVENTDGKLLPYLTARLQFEVAKKQKVLIVSNAALRWQPRPRDLAPEDRKTLARTNRRPPVAPARKSDHGASEAVTTTSTLWVRDAEFVRPISVKVGLSDGVSTEVSSETLGEGTEVVIGHARVDDSASATPFLPQFGGDADESQ